MVVVSGAVGRGGRSLILMAHAIRYDLSCFVDLDLRGLYIRGKRSS